MQADRTVETIADAIASTLASHPVSDGRIPPAVAATLLAQDVYRLILPETLGGSGFDPWQQFDLVERIAARDASVGWNVAVGSGIGLFAGYLPPEQTRRMFSTPDVCIAGSGAPQGTAERVSGGYRVTGRFRWASGIDQARWVYGGCFITENGERLRTADGAYAVVQIFAPRDAATIHDNWQVGGLRATGSKDFSLEELFIPDMQSFMAPVAQIHHPAPIFRVPTTFFGFALSGVPIGVAQNAVDALTRLGKAQSSTSPGDTGPRSALLYSLGRAQALVDASRASLQSALAGIWEPVVRDDTPSLAARARVRRAIVLAAETCIEVTDLCYRSAGGAALFTENGFEGALRDAHAIGGHLVFQRSMMEDAGRVGLGLAPLLPVF